MFIGTPFSNHNTKIMSLSRKPWGEKNQPSLDSYTYEFFEASPVLGLVCGHARTHTNARAHT
jgi:hypothetical protein